jgi:hypothetical protein
MKFSAFVIGMTLVAAPIAVASSAQVDLTVQGKIMPSSCDVFVRGGDLDLEDIPIGDLEADETKPTHLVNKENELEIVCGGPARFGLWASDLSTGGGNGLASFGLGLGTNEKPMGHMVISERNDGFNADGHRAFLAFTEDHQVWSESSRQPMPFSQVDYLLGLNKDEGSTSGPDFIQRATIWLAIAVTIAPKMDLALEDQLTLAGHVAFEIKYF